MAVDLELTHVLKRPLLSEKSTYGMNEENRFAFVVDPRANKTQIKEAVEKIYKVRVLGVNTMVRKAATRRTRFGVTLPSPTKKAVVRLHPDDKLELF
jgi:large subunit ribosomal protein L23